MYIYMSPNGIVGLARLMGTAYEKVIGRDYIFRAKVNPEELDAVGLITDSVGEVAFQGDNPYNGAYTRDKDDPWKVAKLLEDTTEELDSKDEDYEFKLVLTHINDQIKYELAPNTGLGSTDDVIEFTGTLAEGVESEEVEDTVRQYGVDRYTDGWEFPVHDSLEDFQSPDEYEVCIEDLQSGLIEGQVEGISYAGEDYSDLSDEEATELVSELLELDENLKQIRVEEISADDMNRYLVRVEEPVGEGYEIKIAAQTRLFPQQEEPGLESQAEKILE